MITVLQVIICLVLWHVTSNGLIPSPLKVTQAFLRLLTGGVLLDNILVSIVLTIKALFYSRAFTKRLPCL